MPLEKGVFILSIDTELAWGGVHDGSFARRLHLYERTREAIARLLALLEVYQVRATWAVVGHLFLDGCGASNGVKHPEIVQPSYSWFRGDWFDSDPCASAVSAPFWYAPDVIEAILGCRVPQEIGSHGFSHMIAGDPGCSAECFDSELRASQEAANAWGLTLKSFVFPRNSIGHLDRLAANGFTSFRGLPPSWHHWLPAPARRLGRGLENALPVPAVTAQPRKVHGLWDLPATCFYLYREGWAGRIPVGVRVLKSVLGLRRAARDRAIYHLWFHPFNLASDMDGLIGGLDDIFREVARLREAGEMDNLTMADMAERLSAGAAAR